jgi:hypothetical protein
MALSIRGILFAALIFISGCSTLHRNGDGEFERWEADAKKEYNDQFGRFEITPAELPAFEKKTFDRPARKMLLVATEKTRLELTLGKRRVIKEGRYRTSSHYRLLDHEGRTFAIAESTLSLQDLPRESDFEITLFSDPAQHSWLIAESESWSTHRYILIRPNAEADTTSNQFPKSWTATYLRLPLRRSVNPVGPQAQILGLSAGCLYLDQEGHIYRFPIEILQQESGLEFTIG